MKIIDYKVLITAVLSMALILAFQNCGKDYKSNFLGQNSQNVKFDSNVAGADISWIVMESNPLMKLNENGKVTRWYDVTNKLIPLYPPVIAGSSTLDLDHSSQIILSKKEKRLQFGPKSYLSPVAQDAGVFLGDEYSVILHIGSIEIPTTDPKVTRIFQLYAINGEEAGHLVLDITESAENKINFTVVQWFNGNSYAVNKVTLDKSESVTGYGVAMRFGKSADQLSLAVNGEMAKTDSTLIGSVPNLGFVNRKFEIHSSSYGGLGSFDFSEIGIFKRSLNDDELKSFSYGLYQNHELQGEISMSNGIPNLNGGSGLSPTTNPNDSTTVVFSSIKPLFEKSIQGYSCKGCHMGVDTKAGLLAKTNASGTKWIDLTSPTSSLLLKSLKHTSGVTAMPQTGGSMLSEDIQKIESWITQGGK